MLKFCKPKHLYAEQGENIDESVFLVKSRRFTTFFRSFVYLQQKSTCRLGQVGFRDERRRFSAEKRKICRKIKKCLRN